MGENGNFYEELEGGLEVGWKRRLEKRSMGSCRVGN